MRRRRNKKPKRESDVRRHASRRLLERYGLEAEELDRFVGQVRSRSPLAKFISRQSNMRSHWRVTASDGQNVEIVWDRRFGVVTAIPIGGRP